jgi:uncharacterized membrane protein
VPIWFDLVLILSFAWTGLLFGFLSLYDIEKILRKYFSKPWVTFFSVGLIFLGSFGIYLGRYLRWNSWDMITEPYRILYDIKESITNPIANKRAWGMTFSMGMFLNIVYWSFRLIKDRD